MYEVCEVCCSVRRKLNSHARPHIECVERLCVLKPNTGISVMMALLLLASRRAIMDNTPTALSRALSFLVRYTLRRVYL